MGEAFKTQVQVDVRGLSVFFLYEMACFRKPGFVQPLAWGGAKDLFKIALKTRQAPAGELGKLFHRHVEAVVAAHKFFQVYLVRFGKIKQQVTKLGHGMQQQLHHFFHFQEAHGSGEVF